MSRVRFIDHSPGWFSGGTPGRYVLATDLLAVADDLRESIEIMKCDPTNDQNRIKSMEAVNDVYESFVKQVLTL